MPLRPVDVNEFGAVDSRSNPLCMPANRRLQLTNWVVTRAGILQLRDGYEEVPITPVVNQPVHSVCPFKLLDSVTREVLFMQGTTPKRLNLASLEVETVPTEAAFTSSARLSYYVAGNRLHAVNGTDAKFYDGTKWRDLGLPELSAAEVANVDFNTGVRELTSTEAAAVTITLGAGGSFPADTFGRRFHVALYDLDLNEIGPATIPVGTVQSFGLNQQATLANLPVTTPNWAKLIAVTDDGGNNAWFCTDTEKAITSIARTGDDVTVFCLGHGLSVNQVVILSSTTDPAYCQVWTVNSVPDADHFGITFRDGQTGRHTAGASTGGTMRQLVVNYASFTSITVSAPTVDKSFTVNADRGLAVSTIGGAQPGYQFYAAIWNPVTGHVGNRRKIGKRVVPTDKRNWYIHHLPTLANPEWELLIGRTSDGAEVPYACADPLLNWHSALVASDILVEAGIDGSAELPTRNGQLPAGTKAASQVGDRIYAIVAGSPYIYRSEDLSSARARGGTFVGCPEQSFAKTAEMFPLAEEPVLVGEYNHEAWFGTRHDAAILSDLAGVLGWQGPWNLGFAGQYAMAKGFKGLPYWLTGDKQLATLSPEGPMPISDEYEAALLAKIGDQYLGASEVLYYRDAALQKDELRIHARDASGTSFTVIHDFNLRDGQSPWGQAYSAVYAGPLAGAHTQTVVRDQGDRLRVFAGAANGRLYQFYSGASDAGQEYDADCVALLYGGPNRNAVIAFEWFGDPNLQIYFSNRLDTPDDLARFTRLTDDVAQTIDGEAGNSHYRVPLEEPEFTHAYLRLQLRSHSADGDLTLNDPVHMPLEVYGRVYLLTSLLGTARGK